MELYLSDSWRIFSYNSDSRSDTNRLTVFIENLSSAVAKSIFGMV